MPLLACPHEAAQAQPWGLYVRPSPCLPCPRVPHPPQLRGKIVGTSVTWSASGVLFGQLVNYLVFQRSNGCVAAPLSGLAVPG